MNTQDRITYGQLTLAQLSELITENTVSSNGLSVKLTWGFQDGKIYGRVFSSEVELLYEKFYKGKHTHVHLAQMHLDFSHYLTKLAISRRSDFRPAKGASASGMTIGERATRYDSM